MPHDVEIRLRSKDETSSQLKTVNEKLEVMKKSLAAAAAAAYTFKQAFDLSKQGAQFIQTGRSFDMLMDKVGAGPDILERLNKAAGGTIDQMSLMGSVSTMLAGVQGELATAIAENAPRLLEIARAAYKLKPALGDVDFIYQSLAAGIKRNTPLLIDNAGIVTKVGEANEKLAAKLGKSVDQLTAEERSMALLFETLEKGQVLIDQVGGSVDSMVDPWARLEAKIKDATNAAKGWLATGIMPWLELIKGGTLNVNTALETHEKQMRETAKTYDDYIQEQIRAHKEAGLIVRATDDQVRVYKLVRGRMVEVSREYEIMTRNAWDNRDAIVENADATDYYQRHMYDLAATLTGEVMPSVSEFATQLLPETEEALKGPPEVIRAEFVPALVELYTAAERGAFFADALGSELAELLVSEQTTSEDLRENLIQSLYDASVAAGAGRDALALLAGLMTDEFTPEMVEAAIKVGVIRERIDILAKQIAEGKLGVPDAVAEIDRLIDRLNNIPTEITSTVRIHTYEVVEREERSPAAPGDRDDGGPPPRGGPRQHGGPVWEGVPYRVGEMGAEWFVPQQNGQIVPNGGGGGIVIQNLTIEMTHSAGMDPRLFAGQLVSALTTREIGP